MRSGNRVADTTELVGVVRRLLKDNRWITADMLTQNRLNPHIRAAALTRIHRMSPSVLGRLFFAGHGALAWVDYRQVFPLVHQDAQMDAMNGEWIELQIKMATILIMFMGEHLGVDPELGWGPALRTDQLRGVRP